MFSISLAVSSVSVTGKTSFTDYFFSRTATKICEFIIQYNYKITRNNSTQRISFNRKILKDVWVCVIIFSNKTNFIDDPRKQGIIKISAEDPKRRLFYGY